jgi:hypothetical protein
VPGYGLVVPVRAAPFQLAEVLAGVTVALATALGLVVVEGSAGLCGGAFASAVPLAASCLPNRHQLLPEPDWQPVTPIAAAKRIAKRALVTRIARAPCARSEREHASGDFVSPLASVLFPENEMN